MHRRVVKLGGSLLLRPTLVADVRQWFADHPADQNLVVVGGGRMVDAVREWDAIRPMASADTHWRCVELLHISFLMCGDWFKEWHLIEDTQQLEDWLGKASSSPQTALVSPRAFYSSPSNQLPEDWRTTTDSIAAFLACVADATELVLLKSCEVISNASASSLVTEGIVDAAFVDLATGDCIFPFERTRVIRLPVTD